MTWICSDEVCRQNMDSPSDTTFYGSAVVDCSDMLQETTDMSCNYCDSSAEDCSDCYSDTFCDVHSNNGGEVEQVTSPFSSDVNWVSIVK